MPRPIILKQQTPQKKQPTPAPRRARDLINKIDEAQLLVKKAQQGGNPNDMEAALNGVREAKEHFEELQKEFKNKQVEKLYDVTKRGNTQAQQLKNKTLLKVVEAQRDFSKKLELPKEQVVNEPRPSRSDSPTISEAYSSRIGTPIAHEIADPPERRPAFQKDLSQVNDWVMHNTGPYHPIPAPRTKLPQTRLRVNTPEHLYEAPYEAQPVKPIPKPRIKLPQNRARANTPEHLYEAVIPYEERLERVNERLREVQGLEGAMGGLGGMSKDVQGMVHSQAPTVGDISGNVKGASNKVLEGNRGLKSSIEGGERSAFRPVSRPISRQSQRGSPTADLEERVNERLREVQGLEGAMGGVGEMARDTQRMVRDQGPTANEINRNVSYAANNVRLGNRDLESAVNSKKAYRRKLAVLGALGIGAGGAAALGIGLGVGLNKIGNTKNNVDNVINKQSTIGQKDSNEDDEYSNDGYIVDDISSQTNKYARGGRIDGCATKGKTRGRII